MAVYFTGTSTGQKYQVGKSYEMSGAKYTAQKDGSFRKEGNIVGTTDNGKVIVDNVGRGSLTQGSSGNPNVKWYADAGSKRIGSVSKTMAGTSLVSSVGKAGSQIASTRAQAHASREMRVAAGVGVRGSHVVEVSRPARAGASQTFSAWRAGRIAPWSGIDDPEQHYQVAGMHMVASPRSSNMAMIEERHGDAEFLSPAWFASWGVAGDDYVHNLSLHTYGPKHQDRAHRAAVQKAAVEDAGEAIVNWGFDTIAGMRASAAADAAKRRRAEQTRKELRDAELYRQELERAEATALELRREQRNQPQRWDQIRFLGSN